MRVLQIIPSLGMGGAERMLSRLVHHLKRAGHVVGVVSLYDSGHSSVEAELRGDGADLFFLGKRRGPDLRMIPRIARAVASFEPDVLHSHSSHVLRYALAALPPWRWHTVLHTLHNMAEYEADGPGRLMQHVAFRAGVVPIAIGEAVAASVLRTYRMPPRSTIPNGIPVRDYVPRPGVREAVRASLGLPSSTTAFLAVGRFKAQKDHATLLTAFASDRLRLRDVRLVLAGDGELRDELERRAVALRVQDRVQFLGIRSDVPRLLAGADVFVLSSRFEGNPLCVMEAMAAGLPIVATAVGCVPELVTSECGRLVTPGDPGSLAESMAELADDGALARDQGAAAARIARERFDETLMAQAYEEIYAEVA